MDNSSRQHLVLDVTKICRTCMQEGKMTDLYDNCDEDDCVLEKLMYCTLIQVRPKDGLPSQICHNCLNRINAAYNFAKKCETTDRILRQFCGVLDKNISIPADQIQITDENSEITINIRPENPIEETVVSDFDVNFDPNVYTDHTYDKKSSQKLIKPKETEEIEPPKKYVCKRCEITFPVYHLLKEHYKTHGKKEYFGRACPICSKVISYGHLKTHLMTHSTEKPFCCEICGKRFKLGGNLTRHKRVHSGEKPYACDICGKCFSQSTRMKDHRRIHTGEKPYVCHFCGKSFAQFSAFKFHKDRHETLKTRAQNISRKPRTVSDKTYKCDICSQVYKSIGGLKTHLVTHNEKIYNCTVCNRGFDDLSRLRRHTLGHNLARQFHCLVCEKSFMTKSSLKSHMFIHTGQKPFSCEICDKSFAQISQLQYHAKVHSGVKPYKCKYCSKAFTFNGNLTVHLRIHTGETPYNCSVCNKAFSDLNRMKKHLKLH